MDKKLVAQSALKGLLGGVPYVGQALSETLFGYRQSLKQKRIENFIQSFKNSISKFQEKDLNIDQIKEEHFSDFFEELLVNISKTASEEKVDRFRKLLLKQLTDPKEIEYSELYLQILNSLREKQILILAGFYEGFSASYVESKGEIIRANRELEEIEREIEDRNNWTVIPQTYGSGDDDLYRLERRKKELKELIKKNERRIDSSQKLYDPETYHCEGYEFFYLVQDLGNKGLIVDRGIEYGARPYQLAEITQLGMDLIARIQTNPAT